MNISKIDHLVLNNNHSINQSKLLFTNKILITPSLFDPIPPDCETQNKIRRHKSKDRKYDGQTKDKKCPKKKTTTQKATNLRKSRDKVL